MEKPIIYKGYKFIVNRFIGNNNILLAYNNSIDKQISAWNRKDLIKQIRALVNDFITYERLRDEFGRGF